MLHEIRERCLSNNPKEQTCFLLEKRILVFGYIRLHSIWHTSCRSPGVCLGWIERGILPWRHLLLHWCQRSVRPSTEELGTLEPWDLPFLLHRLVLNPLLQWLFEVPLIFWVHWQSIWQFPSCPSPVFVWEHKWQMMLRFTWRYTRRKR